MSDIAIKAENISKLYRLGNVNAASMRDDMLSMWARMLGKEDPTLSLAQANDRTQKGTSEYVWSLKDINFEVKKGDIVGIIGKNGAGKSTLLKILSKVTAPTTGSIKMNGRIASLLEVGTGFHPELTGKENIYLNGHILGMRKKEIDRKFDEIVDFSGVERYIDTPVKRYSSGMYVRLAFGVAAHLESDILIIDEVLAVGDAEFQKKCLGKMQDVSKGEGRTVLFVSHNMPSIKAICKNGIILKQGRIDFQGDVKQTIAKYFDSAVKMNQLGIIPDNYERYNTGEAKIRKVFILNDDSIPSEDVFYKAPIRIKIEIEVFKPINDALVDIKIVTKDGVVITHSMNVFDGSIPYNLAEGIHIINLEIENSMQVGNYSLDCGIHYSSGDTIDYLENFYNFQVIRLSKSDEQDEKYIFEHGFFRLKSKWMLEQFNKTN
jgi:lipopolysaccharide transport system ATP-binding protein